MFLAVITDTSECLEFCAIKINKRTWAWS